MVPAVRWALRTAIGRPQQRKDHGMRRREFIVGLGGSAAWPAGAHAQQEPRKVALFSGHMIDAPGREKPRFPPDKEPVAAHAIAETLTDLGVGPADLGICVGACGGDLLFAEAVLARGGRLELYIPFDGGPFSKSQSILPTVIGAPDILPPRREPSFISLRPNSGRSAKRRTPTSATTAGC